MWHTSLREQLSDSSFCQSNTVCFKMFKISSILLAKYFDSTIVSIMLIGYGSCCLILSMTNALHGYSCSQVKKVPCYFYLLFGFRTTNSEPFVAGLPHQPDVNHIIKFQSEGHWEPCNKVGLLSTIKHLVVCSQCFRPLGHSLSVSLCLPLSLSLSPSLPPSLSLSLTVCLSVSLSVSLCLSPPLPLPLPLSLSDKLIVKRANFQVIISNCY